MTRSEYARLQEDADDAVREQIEVELLDCLEGIAADLLSAARLSARPFVADGVDDTLTVHDVEEAIILHLTQKHESMRERGL